MGCPNKQLSSILRSGLTSILHSSQTSLLAPCPSYAAHGPTSCFLEKNKSHQSESFHLYTALTSLSIFPSLSRAVELWNGSSVPLELKGQSLPSLYHFCHHSFPYFHFSSLCTEPFPLVVQTPTAPSWPHPLSLKPVLPLPSQARSPGNSPRTDHRASPHDSARYQLASTLLLQRHSSHRGRLHL